MSDLYTAGTLADHGVVVITVNYRLGVFGFLAHAELTGELAPSCFRELRTNGPDFGVEVGDCKY